MKFILLLLLSTIGSSFKHFSKRRFIKPIYALKKPNNKEPEDRDNFENFEEYSRIQDLEMQRFYFHKIYYQLNNMTNVLQIDLRNMVNILDENMITNVLGHIPKRPETEDEIIEDSFEGFLRDEFAKIPKTKSNLIDFHEYYIWRKKAGLVLTEEEVLLYYTLVVGEGELCNLMQFISINHLIDESDFPL